MNKFNKFQLKIKIKNKKEDDKRKKWINSITTKTLDKTCRKCNTDLKDASFSFSGECGYYNYSNRCCIIRCTCQHIIFVNKKWMKNSWKIIGYTSLIYDAFKHKKYKSAFGLYQHIHNYPEAYVV